MQRLSWIKDELARNAVDLFQSQMEAVILGLLGEDFDEAYVKLEAARDETLKIIKGLDFDFIPIEQETEVLTRVIELTEHSFQRMLAIVKACRDDEPDV